MNEKELSLQIAEDYTMVCKEAKEMGYSKIKALYNIPLKNMECMIHALEYYASSLLPEKESVDFKNKGCETDKNRVCYSRKACSYSGEPIDFYARKCNAYELSEGACTACSELFRKNKNKKETFDLNQVNNLEELIDLVGENTVAKCFTEYMMRAIAKAQKLDDLQRHIESLTKMSNGEIPLRSGDLLTMLNAPLFVSIDEK